LAAVHDAEPLLVQAGEVWVNTNAAPPEADVLESKMQAASTERPGT